MNFYEHVNKDYQEYITLLWLKYNIVCSKDPYCHLVQLDKMISLISISEILENPYFYSQYSYTSQPVIYDIKKDPRRCNSNIKPYKAYPSYAYVLYKNVDYLKAIREVC